MNNQLQNMQHHMGMMMGQMPIFTPETHWQISEVEREVPSRVQFFYNSSDEVE
jgi:hypothetical protein